MRLKLVKLEDKYREQLTAMMDEWHASGEKIKPWAISKTDYRDFENYKNRLEVSENADKTASGNAGGPVPDSTYFCLDEDRNIFVGAVNIRHTLNGHLLLHGGHIGDGVRPSERQKGIATKMISLALIECKKLGIYKVLMTCDKDNTASAKSIVYNGGVLENEVVTDGVIIQRYWIQNGLSFSDIMKQNIAYAVRHNEESIMLQKGAKKLCYDYNQTLPGDAERRAAILKELFGTYHPETIIEPPFHCDYGFNIHASGFLFMNYNCSILDTSPVRLGKNVFIAPGVCIACAGHGIHPEQRTVIEVSKPIKIGNNVWIRANATVCGGVAIGDNSVIGAGSVVNKDIPSGVIAAGVPCRVIREITDEDKISMEGDIVCLPY